MQSVLSHTHQEVSDQLWNGLSNGADNDLEVGVDTSTDFLNKDVGTAARVLVLRSRLAILALRIVNKVSVLVVLGHILLLRHNRCAVLLVVLIVDEHVVLL